MTNNKIHATDSLSELEERLFARALAKEESRALEIKRAESKLENFATDFDFACLEDFMCSEGKDYKTFDICSYETFCFKKDIVRYFKPTLLSRIRIGYSNRRLFKNINGDSLILGAIALFIFMFAFVGIVLFMMAVIAFLGISKMFPLSDLCYFTGLSILLVAGAVFLYNVIEDICNVAKHLGIKISKRKQIKLHELRLLFVQLSKLNLNPKIEFDVEFDKKSSRKPGKVKVRLLVSSMT